MTNGSLGAGTTHNFETYKGSFKVKYNDRGNILGGTAEILLKNNGDMYKVEGECIDTDGIARIAEGFVSYSGHGWWVEETLTGPNKGLKVLTEGKFDFGTDSFSGAWRANTGVQGTYALFLGSNVSKTFDPLAVMASPPLAETTMETPLLGAALPVVQAVQETNSPATAYPNVPEPYVPHV